MRYLFNSDNELLNASIAASNVIASKSYRRIDTDPKIGGGNVILSGDFTGQEDSEYEVRIVGGSSTAPLISNPAFSGVGNGELYDISTVALAAQVFTITLRDIGTETRQAYVPFQNFRLRSKLPGDGGNSISISVDPSPLVRTSTKYAVRAGMSTSTNEFIGDEFNFDAVTLNVDGTIPLSAPRIRFGDDPQVYLPYRKYVDGQYVYSFSPKLVRDVVEGTKVYGVSGGRHITISDGITSEVLGESTVRQSSFLYTVGKHYKPTTSNGHVYICVVGGTSASSPPTFPVDGTVFSDGSASFRDFGLLSLVTLYDFLLAIETFSQLIEIEGNPINDRTPGGQAATDLSVWTRPYVARTLRDGTDYIKNADVTIVPSALASTEILSIVCKANAIPGSEVWSVSGQASGTLVDATTGLPYSSGGVSFTIPPQLNPEVLDGYIRVSYHRPNWDGVTSLPFFSVKAAALGPRAQNGIHSFVYRPRPKPGCLTPGDYEGALSPSCLGAIPDPEVSTVSQASRSVRLQRLSNWRRKFIDTNTSSPSNNLGSADHDIDFVNRSAGILRDCLNNLALGRDSWPSWESSVITEADTVIEPTVPNGFKYVARNRGITGIVEPTWPTTVGATIAGPSIVWECLSKKPYSIWDDAFIQLQADADPFQGLGYPNKVKMLHPNTSYAVGDVVFADEIVGPDKAYVTPIKALYLITSAGTSGEFYPKVTLAGADFGRVSDWLVYLATPTPVGVPVPLGDAGYFEYVYGVGTPNGNVFGGQDVIPPMAVRLPLITLSWIPSMAVTVGQFVVANTTPLNAISPTMALFRASTTGAVGASPPTWPTAVGGSVADNTVTWIRVGGNLTVPIDDAYLTRYESWSTEILNSAELDPDFEVASTDGDGCWRDYEEVSNWWESTDSFMPMFHGHPYVSSIEEIRGDGSPYIRTTQEFGFGVSFGCDEKLAIGDVVTVELNGLGGVSTYQKGDTVQAQINRATPLLFGGGQTGTDTLKFSVVGSGTGTLADYLLDLTLPTPTLYSAAGLSFRLKAGTLPYGLGDQFRFSVENASAEWRKVGGSWSSPVDISGVPLAMVDGLFANFQGGLPPSWVPGDKWVFEVVSVNGAGNLRSPVGQSFEWVGTTTVDIGSLVGPVEFLNIIGHEIPSTSTVTLQGSDDGFSTTPLSTLVPHRKGSMGIPVPTTYAQYRLLVTDSGRIDYLWMGVPYEMTDSAGVVDSGKVKLGQKFGNFARLRSQTVGVTHEFVSQQAVDGFADRAELALQTDSGRVALLMNGESSATVHVLPDGEVVLEEVFDFQPEDPSHRLLSPTYSFESV